METYTFQEVLYMKKWIPVCSVAIVMILLFGILTDHAVTVFSESAPIENRVCVVIDAGHGGEDGGATSCTGELESQINLQIALRLNDLLHLIGIDTKMIRTTDRSVFTEGNTISARKLSDLKERVKIINNTENAILISVHQNTFPEKIYHGAQVFYGIRGEGEALAKQMQHNFVSTLNLGSNRKAKKANSVYLMDKIKCTGVLVECGFISNPQEAALLNSVEYQNKVCIVIASTLSTFLYS